MATPLGERLELEAPDLGRLSPLFRQRLRDLVGMLWRDASAIDADGVIPAEQLQAFADVGLYGAMAPEDEGGLGLGHRDLCAVLEELASGCVAAAFLWAQHLGLLGTVLDPATPEPVRLDLRAKVIGGTVKGGVALTGLMPGPARLRAAPAGGGGWLVDGEAPWVSGWGIVDKLLVVARGPDETIVTLLLDAHEQAGLNVTPARLSALEATRTVKLDFAGLAVDAGRFVSRRDIELAKGGGERLRLNGSFALGLVKRCCLLIGPSPLDAELAACREQLDVADDDHIAGARGAACELAVRSSHVLSVTRGSVSALAGDVAERLSREAAVLLVFGSRPGIKAGLLQRFHAAE